MTLTDLEREVKKLPLGERAELLARVQLTDDERDELDDHRDLEDPGVLDAIAKGREDVRAGRVRAISELLTELDADKRTARRA